METPQAIPGGGTPYASVTTHLSSRGGTVESPRGVASPLDGEEFSDEPGEQWSACLSLLEAGEELKKIFN